MPIHDMRLSRRLTSIIEGKRCPSNSHVCLNAKLRSAADKSSHHMPQSDCIKNSRHGFPESLKVTQHLATASIIAVFHREIHGVHSSIRTESTSSEAIWMSSGQGFANLGFSGCNSCAISAWRVPYQFDNLPTYTEFHLHESRISYL